MKPLTAERLRELMRYDPGSGTFTRITSRGGAKAGDTCGCSDRLGYVFIGVDYVLHKAHRLAWLYVTGNWPAGEIDHIDGDPGNNRFANLRDVPRKTNAENQRKARCNNRSSGFLGVKRSAGGRWRAAITVNGRTIHLGVRGSPAEAHELYVEAKRRMHAGCTI